MNEVQVGFWVGFAETRRSTLCSVWLSVITLTDSVLTGWSLDAVSFTNDNSRTRVKTIMFIWVDRLFIDFFLNNYYFQKKYSKNYNFKKYI